VALVLLVEGIYEVRNWDAFMLQYILTKFHEDWCRRSRNIKVFLKILRDCNVDITDRRDFLITPLRWIQVP
jgi:hypothetical protein